MKSRERESERERALDRDRERVRERPFAKTSKHENVSKAVG